MDIELVEIRVFCMGCKSQMGAEEAALIGWKYCSQLPSLHMP